MRPSDIEKARLVFLVRLSVQQSCVCGLLSSSGEKIIDSEGKRKNKGGRKKKSNARLSVLLLHGPPEKQLLVTLVAAASCA